MSLVRLSVVGLGFTLAVERTAAACPFCGGWGTPAEGAFQTLAMIAVFGLGARALSRWMKRRHRHEPEAPPRNPSSPDSRR